MTGDRGLTATGAQDYKCYGSFYKLGAVRKAWKERFFARKGMSLVYLRAAEVRRRGRMRPSRRTRHIAALSAPHGALTLCGRRTQDRTPLGTIDLRYCTGLSEAADGGSAARYAVSLETTGRTYRLATDDSARMAELLADIRHCMRVSASPAPSPGACSTANIVSTTATPSGPAGAALGTAHTAGSDASPAIAAADAPGNESDDVGSSDEYDSDVDPDDADDPKSSPAVGDVRSTVPVCRSDPAAQGVDRPLEISIVATLFRANSFASKLMKFYSRYLATPYLRSVIGPWLQTVISARLSIELQPHRLEGKGQTVEQNLAALNATCTNLVQAIFSAAGRAPASLRLLCRHMRTGVAERFPSVALRAVGGFLFLRYFCPAIVQPEYYGIIDRPAGARSKSGQPEAIDEPVRRTLVLITKVLQNLASNVLYGSKEEHMVPMNAFLERFQAPMQTYLESISAAGAEATAGATGAGQVHADDRAAITVDRYRWACGVLREQLAQLAVVLAEEVATLRRHASAPDGGEHARTLPPEQAADAASAMDFCSRLLTAVSGSGASEPLSRAQMHSISDIVCNEPGMRTVRDLLDATAFDAFDDLAEALLIVFAQRCAEQVLLQWAIAQEVAGIGITPPPRRLRRAQPASRVGNDIVRAGYVYKKAGRMKVWKRRWLVLRGSTATLSYYVDEAAMGSSGAQLGTIDLRRCSAVTEVETVLTGRRSFELTLPGRTYYFAADNEADHDAWIAMLQKRIAGRVAGLREGYMHKLGANVRNWKRRYFVLLEDELRYYANREAANPLGIIRLAECHAIRPCTVSGVGHTFEIVVPHRVFVLACESEADMNEWIAVIGAQLAI